jgi:hypothetical protein
VERRRRIVEETLHLKEIDGRLRRKLRLRSLLPPQERLTGSVCSLVDSRQWSGSLYHWFLDGLPRLIAVDHHSHRFGEPTRVIVPAILNPWQEASLHLLGIAPERRIRHCPVGRGGLRVERLIASVAHRQRPRPGGSTLAEGCADSPSGQRGSGAGPARTPRLCGGAKRTALPRRADRPVSGSHPHRAPQGASLTNLLHARGGSVLELFQEGHGVRTDFFQLAMINQLDYHHALCPSSGAARHCVIPTQVIKDFLALTL